MKENFENIFGDDNEKKEKLPELDEETREEWKKEAELLGATDLLIVYNKPEEEHFPVFVKPGESLEGRLTEYGLSSSVEIQEILEIDSN